MITYTEFIKGAADKIFLDRGQALDPGDIGFKIVVYEFPGDFTVV
ncbi:hypothetical protein [uncultured Desulfobacter sp.]|nr:hypothetical protein [uncultured Desulfobacter sp.]